MAALLIAAGLVPDVKLIASKILVHLDLHPSREISGNLILTLREYCSIYFSWN